METPRSADTALVWGSEYSLGSDATCVILAPTGDPLSLSSHLISETSFDSVYVHDAPAKSRHRF